MAKPAPISNETFLAAAGPLPIKVGDVVIGYAQPKTFATGSVGYGLNAKATVEVGGVPVPVQVSANLTVIGSKHGAEGSAAA